MSRGKSRANCLFLLCKLAVFTAGKLFSLTIRFTAAATFGGYIYYFPIIKDKFVNEIIIALLLKEIQSLKYWQLAANLRPRKNPVKTVSNTQLQINMAK
jgi:hypothetical protein